MDAARHLIVNADDLGLSAGVNAGIFAAHERGIVTSASLMVRQAAAPEAARLALSYPRLAIGLHLDLGQWDYANGDWFATYLRCDQRDETSVRTESRAQVEAFRGLLGREPTHLDSHQHVHDSEPVSSVMTAIAEELGVPLRGRRIRYEGGFYGQSGKGEPHPQGITPSHLVELIRALPAGWTELGCHPAMGIVGPSSYGHEREDELKSLCDSAVSDALQHEGVQLRSFAELGGP